MASRSMSADSIRNRYSSSSSSFRLSSRYSSESKAAPSSLGYQDSQELASMNSSIEINHQTTEMAKDAAKLATQIVEVADDTTLELVRQQYVLDEVERKQEQIREDTKVAEHAAAYVARRGCWTWIFACCCTCDPHANEDISARGVQHRRCDPSGCHSVGGTALCHCVVQTPTGDGERSRDAWRAYQGAQGC